MAILREMVWWPQTPPEHTLPHSKLQQDSIWEVWQVDGQMKGKSYLRYRQVRPPRVILVREENHTHSSEVFIHGLEEPEYW